MRTLDEQLAEYGAYLDELAATSEPSELRQVEGSDAASRSVRRVVLVDAVVGLALAAAAVTALVLARDSGSPRVTASPADGHANTSGNPSTHGAPRIPAYCGDRVRNRSGIIVGCIGHERHDAHQSGRSGCPFDFGWDTGLRPQRQPPDRRVLGSARLCSPAHADEYDTLKACNDTPTSGAPGSSRRPARGWSADRESQRPIAASKRNAVGDGGNGQELAERPADMPASRSVSRYDRDRDPRRVRRRSSRGSTRVLASRRPRPGRYPDQRDQATGQGSGVLTVGTGTRTCARIRHLRVRMGTAPVHVRAQVEAMETPSNPATGLRHHQSCTSAARLVPARRSCLVPARRSCMANCRRPTLRRCRSSGAATSSNSETNHSNSGQYPGSVIPIVFFVGLAVGRWWFLPVATIGWTIVLVAFGIAGDWRTIVVGADLES